MRTAPKSEVAKNLQKTLAPDFQRDVREWYMRETMPDLLDTLQLNCAQAKRNGCKTNIICGTDDYKTEHGEAFAFKKAMRAEQITVKDERIICPRVGKRIEEQRKRFAEKAEACTPSWVCNQEHPRRRGVVLSDNVAVQRGQSDALVVLAGPYRRAFSNHYYEH